MKWTFQQEVRYRLIGKPHLVPIFSHALNIPERIYEYDDSFFIVYNSETDYFEVHSLENKGDTHCFQVNYKSLDARTLRQLYRNDIRVHGKEIFRRIEKSEEQMKKAKDKKFKNWVEDVAKETRSMFAEDAWTI